MRVSLLNVPSYFFVLSALVFVTSFASCNGEKEKEGNDVQAETTDSVDAPADSEDSGGDATHSETLDDATGVTNIADADAVDAPDLPPLPQCGPSAPITGPGDDGFYKVELADAVEKNAVCNDGCPYIYFIRPGTSGAENKWVIFFKGGDSCSSPEACEQRWIGRRHWMRPGPPRPSNEGIMDPDPEKNPDWHNWTTVYLHYCSSDLFMGDTGPDPEAGNRFHFRGKRISREALADLLDPRFDELPSLRDAEEVIVAGGSSGGNGMRQNLDEIAALLAPIPVVGVNDSAYVPEARRADEWERLGGMNLEERAALIREAFRDFWNAQPDESCLAEAPDPMMCYDADYVLTAGHVTTPVYVFMDQFDSPGINGEFIYGMCVESPCDEQSGCGPGQECAPAGTFELFSGSLCLGGECTAEDECGDGHCSESNRCFALHCSSNDDCRGLICNQGFCAEPWDICTSDADCGGDLVCTRGLCGRGVPNCTPNSGCRDGEDCIEDTSVCVSLPGCATDADCSEQTSCLNRRLTPWGQNFAREVRGLLDTFTGALSTRWGTHVLITKDAFLARNASGLVCNVDGQCVDEPACARNEDCLGGGICTAQTCRWTYADLLANWYFGRAGPTKLIMH